MRWWVWCLLSWGLAGIIIVRADIFSSTAHLEHLLHLERHLVNILHNYVENTEKKIAHVRNYLDNFYDSYREVLNENASLAGDEMSENPLQAYQLVKRLTIDWSDLKKIMDRSDWAPATRLTRQYEALMPKTEDLNGAALALVRLQDTYKLDMSAMAEGKIQGINSGTGLTARDLLYLGKQSFQTGFYGHAIRWLEQALRKAYKEGNTTAGVDEIVAYMDAAVQVHDNLFERTDIDLSNYDILDQPVSKRINKVVSPVRPKCPPRLGLNNTLHEDQEIYTALCRGESLRSPAVESALHCRLETRGNPYLFLHPIKTEIVSWDPYLVLFHDLLSHEQTDLLREIAEPKLSRSLVQAGGGTEVVSLSRTSQNAWLGPDDHPAMARAYRLVQEVTGLSTDVSQEHAEVVQIANYGMGGHYTPHYDYLLVDKTEEEMQYVHPKEIEAGDRTATLMFYLSDVTRGGATVFPKIGAGVWPRRGSAVFWYNLKSSGRENELTLHGACPVLHGSKWVANFWIREKGQTFRRKCDLNPEL